ncbi:ribosomal protein S18 acetylase RimI-like enzyme [Paenibacillus sp. BK033]|uniref:GNAT family N-acetyltransferase n=1 Tax=Paenibacillus sp. BK033 TaxID=2512133 RepID=UPI001049C07C|nr:GNAT family N-acetyltransferase [Paenibacillus sp. BK033]TCN01988.1 ribosomal protein S18 acetylase RimI-like enzyme [Paenibacillus sp. BK033]
MIQLLRVSAEHADFRALIKLLDKDLWNRYPDTQQFFDAHNQVKLEANAVVAYLDDRPVGCGCYREMSDEYTVEIKRMFVKEEARGRGIAKRIVKELEQWAAEEGKREALLETGTGQPEAISLYKKLGYVRVANYGPYIGSEESVCMGKKLV